MKTDLLVMGAIGLGTLYYMQKQNQILSTQKPSGQAADPSIIVLPSITGDGSAPPYGGPPQDTGSADKPPGSSLDRASAGFRDFFSPESLGGNAAFLGTTAAGAYALRRFAKPAIAASKAVPTAAASAEGAAAASKWSGAVKWAGRGGKVLGRAAVPIAAVTTAIPLAQDWAKYHNRDLASQAVGATATAAGTWANVGGVVTGTKVGYGDKGQAEVYQGVPLVSAIGDLFGQNWRAKVV